MSGGDDWQVGDLALALESLAGGQVVSGKIYRVINVVPIVHWVGGHVGPALTLEGVRHINPCGGSSARKFRKIKPDAEPCEEEFTALIKRMKPAKAPEVTA